MMTFLIVLASLSTIFGIILASSIKLKIYLSKNGYIVVKYLFFSFKYDIYGDNKIKRVKKGTSKNSSKKSEHKNNKNKGGYFKKVIDENGLIDGTVQLLNTVRIIFLKIAELISECKIEDLVLNIKVASDDPANTALIYGGVCAVAYPAIGLLNGIFKVEKQKIDINADYKIKKPEVEFVTVLKLRVSGSIKVAFSLIKEFIQGGF